MLATPPAPPPVVQERKTLHTRIRADLDRVMRQYARDHHTSYQLVIEHALTEYFTARGLWPRD